MRLSISNIVRVTISCLFLRFVLIFKGNLSENMNVLSFEFLAEKIGFCRHDDLFFGLHRILVVKQNSGREGLFFFGLRRLLVVSQ